MNETDKKVWGSILTVCEEERLPLPDIDAPFVWKRVECPTCGKFICKATEGSKVHIVCNRCKTESVTAVAA